MYLYLNDGIFIIFDGFTKQTTFRTHMIYKGGANAVKEAWGGTIGFLSEYC